MRPAELMGKNKAGLTQLGLPYTIYLCWLYAVVCFLRLVSSTILITLKGYIAIVFTGIFSYVVFI